MVNYYLMAGSSYRYSPTWAEKFHDEDNKPKIARSGRFGIGALATFLIWDTATVMTRHMDDELGYQFTYGLEPNTLDVKRVSHVSVGTTIEITLKKEAREYFDFYASDTDGIRVPLTRYPWFA